jgi:hypothetical protein
LLGGEGRLPKNPNVRSAVQGREETFQSFLPSVFTSLPLCEPPSLTPSLTFPKHRRLIRGCRHSLIHSFLHIRAAGLSLLEDPSQPVRSHQFATQRDFTKQPSRSFLHTTRFTSERTQLHRTSKQCPRPAICHQNHRSDSDSARNRQRTQCHLHLIFAQGNNSILYHQHLEPIRNGFFNHGSCKSTHTAGEAQQRRSPRRHRQTPWPHRSYADLTAN